MRYLVLIGAVMFLCACTQQQAEQDAKSVKSQFKEDIGYVEDQMDANLDLVSKNVNKHVKRVADNIRDGAKKTNRRVRDWWLEPTPEEVDTPLDSSYCYNVMQDILCYRQPRVGWEHRLVGYQGTHAKAPPAPVTRPLALNVVDGRKEIDRRIKSAKPVFVKIPKEPKEDEGKKILGIDSAHEALPDPLLSPQL